MTESKVRCTSCSKIITVQIYGAGLSDVIPFTCDRDSTVITVSTYDSKLEEVLGGYPRAGWTDDDYKKVEARLIGCPCGGSFRRSAQPRCPNCGVALDVRGLRRLEFIVVGQMIDGDKRSIWK